MPFGSTTTSLALGSTVTTQERHRGVVRYVGSVRFASESWVGIELDGPYGTCDGSVDGVRYFQCKARHGVFRQAETLTLLSARRPPKSPRPASLVSAAATRMARPRNFNGRKCGVHERDEGSVADRLADGERTLA